MARGPPRRGAGLNKDPGPGGGGGGEEGPSASRERQRLPGERLREAESYSWKTSEPRRKLHGEAQLQSPALLLCCRGIATDSGTSGKLRRVTLEPGSETVIKPARESSVLLVF